LRDGPNHIAHEPPLPAWLHLWRCYLNPFNLLLSGLALLSFLSADAKATVVIVSMVGVSTVIRFVQEGRSHRAAEGLRALVSNTVSVIRRAPGAVPAEPAAGAAAAHELPLANWSAATWWRCPPAT
jgi:Mg2+-importing ATPase